VGADTWLVNLAGPSEITGQADLLKLILQVHGPVPEGVQYRVLATEADLVDESGQVTDVTSEVLPGTVTIDRCEDLWQPGDVDGNGSITVAEANRTLRIAIGLSNPPNDCVRAAADVDCNGNIQVSDAISILRGIVLNAALSACSAAM
jgi:hypothetical protein